MSHRDRGWYLAIEGPTGCGKTTLARRLAEPLGARVFYDPFDRNPFLIHPDHGPLLPGPQAALVMEMTFLALRIGELRRIGTVLKTGHRVIADWALVKTRVFSRVTLTPDEADRIETACALWEPGLPAPDLLIHLHAGVPLLASRIRNRGRAFEQDTTLAELAHQSALFRAVLRGLPVMDIDASTFDAFDGTTVSALATTITTFMSRKKGP